MGKGTTADSAETTEKAESKKGEGNDTVLAALHALRTEVAVLIEVVKSGGTEREPVATSGSLRNRKRGCENCRKAGSGEVCNHCWKCVSQKHWAKGCRQEVQLGNGRRLPPRDRR